MYWLERWTTEQLLCVCGDPGFDDQSHELTIRCDATIQSWIRGQIRGSQAVDVVKSATWLKIFRGKDTFVPAGEGSALRWMRRVTNSAVGDFYREQGRQMAGATEELLEQIPAVDSEAEAVCQLDEEERMAHAAVRRLPGENQAILLLARPGSNEDSIGLGLLTQQQVANLLGASGPAAIYRNLNDTRTRLQTILGVTTDEEDNS